MPFFAVHVRSHGESRFIAVARSRSEGMAASLFFPRRNLRVRRGGTWKDEIAPIFSGYVFLRVDAVEPTMSLFPRSLPGFIRFLPANDRIAALNDRDETMLRHFLSFGEVVERSTVEFDENRRIRVISGPLKGLDGQIVKVDRRRQRARVRLELYHEAFEINFGFQALEPAGGAAQSPSPQPHGGQQAGGPEP